MSNPTNQGADGGLPSVDVEREGAVHNDEMPIFVAVTTGGHVSPPVA